VFIFLGIAFGIVPMLIGYWLGPSKPDEEKNSQFECGFPPFDDSRMYFNVRYYLSIAIQASFLNKSVFFLLTR
jgi:NADH-quinone oxidoreductase subunit A